MVTGEVSAGVDTVSSPAAMAPVSAAISAIDVKHGDNRFGRGIHHDCNTLHPLPIASRDGASEVLQFGPANHQRDTTTADGGRLVRIGADRGDDPPRETPLLRPELGVSCKNQGIFGRKHDSASLRATGNRVS
jgi:hypothetical protein